MSDQRRASSTPSTPPVASQPDRPNAGDLSLGPLLLLLFAIGALLPLVFGAPHVPTTLPRLPTETEVELFVNSPSSSQIAAILAVFTWVVWLLWGWLALTALLRMLLVLAERVAAGTAWVRSIRTLSDLITLPAVRKAVDMSLAGTILLRVAGTPLVGSGFLPEVAQAQVLALGPSDEVVSSAPRTAPENTQIESGDILYTVQPGDSLGTIAEHFYGDWTAYEQIFAANKDAPQPDGRTLQEACRIFPGWQLRLPQPTQAITTADGTTSYTVQKGDTLSSIAAGLLGDADQWHQIWQTNQGKTMADGSTFDDPNAIRPGWQLALTSAPDDSAATAPPTTILPAAPSPPPSPSLSPSASPSPTVAPQLPAVSVVPVSPSPAPPPATSAPQVSSAEPAAPPTSGAASGPPHEICGVSGAGRYCSGSCTKPTA